MVPLKCMHDCYPSTVAVTMKSTLINSIQVWNLIARFCDTCNESASIKENNVSSSCVCFISPKSEIKIKRSTDFLHEI